MKVFDRSAYSLIVCMAINSIVSLFVHTFFIAQILLQTNYNIPTAAMFYVIGYTVLGICSLFFFAIVKKGKSLLFLRLGAFLKATFILLVVLAGDKMIDYIYLFAIFYGIMESVYWCGGNALKNTLVDADKIKTLISTLSIITKVVDIVIPITLGVCIDLTSFGNMAIVIFVMLVIQFVSTLLIKPTFHSKEEFSYKEFLKCLNKNKDAKLIKLAYFNVFLRGIVHFIPTFLVYLIVFTYHTNTSLGMFVTIASIVAIVLLLLFNISKKINTNTVVFLLFAIIPSTAMILCSIWMTPVFIIIFQMTYNACAMTLEALNETKRGSLIREAKLGKFILENFGINELLLNIGRVSGYLILFIVGTLANSVVNIIFSVVFALALAYYALSIGRLEKAIKAKEDKKQKQLCKKYSKTKVEE